MLDRKNASTMLKGCCFNAQGLRNKATEFFNFLIVHEYDFICVTETWLGEDDPFLTECYGYRNFRCDRNKVYPGVGRGGVAIFTKEVLNCEEIIGNARAESGTIRIRCNEIDVYVMAIYRPSNNYSFATFGYTEEEIVEQIGMAVDAVSRLDGPVRRGSRIVKQK